MVVGVIPRAMPRTTTNAPGGFEVIAIERFVPDEPSTMVEQEALIRQHIKIAARSIIEFMGLLIFETC